MFKDVYLVKQIKSFFNSVKNKIISTYKDIEAKIKSILNSTILKKFLDFSCNFFKKLFSPFLKHFSSPSTQQSSQKSSDDNMIDILSKRIQELKETIKSSKIFIRTVIEKIRDSGKIKINNKLNNNPNHPEYQSTFPDLNVSKNEKKENNPYDFSEINDNFHVQVNEDIVKINQKHPNQLNKNIQKFYDSGFINDRIASLLKNSDISKNIKKEIQYFEQPKISWNTSDAVLNQDFMEDFNTSLFVIDGQLIYSTNKDDMIREFKNVVPNAEDQQLIAMYARPKLLNQSYSELASEHPELNQYKVTNSRNIYEIFHLSDGSLQLTVTNLSDIRPINENSVDKYSAFGVRTRVVLSSHEKNILKIEYAHFVN